MSGCAFLSHVLLVYLVWNVAVCRDGFPVEALKPRLLWVWGEGFPDGEVILPSAVEKKASPSLGWKLGSRLIGKLWIFFLSGNISMWFLMVGVWGLHSWRCLILHLGGGGYVHFEKDFQVILVCIPLRNSLPMFPYGCSVSELFHWSVCLSLCHVHAS